MAIIGIVAVGVNGAIGKGGSIPWHYSSDMRFFKIQTTGNACVMGYRTWLSLKKPLKDRLNIVLSRTSEAQAQPSVVTMRDEQSVLSLLQFLSCDLYVIGGEQIYRAFANAIEKWIVTRIPLTVPEADAFMPADFLKGFELDSSLPLEENLFVEFYEKQS